jgi:ABC-type antimicrobial peptide transport system permease subunit
MITGWIKLHRQLLNWEWYSNVNVRLLFIHLLLITNYEDSKFEGMLIKRGQAVIGLLELAKSTSLSVQQIRTALNKLKSTNEITIKSTNKFSIVTLVNYSLYQCKEDEDNNQNNKQDNKQITNKQQTNNKQITTSKELQELQEEKEFKETSEVFKKNLNQTEVSEVEEEYIDCKNLVKEIGGVHVLDLLSEDGRKKVEAYCPQWDITKLACAFAKNIREEKIDFPRNINTAFPAWCLKYTKGEPPK